MIECVYEDYIPEWAVSYLEYGEDENLFNREIDMIESWKRDNGLEGADPVFDFDDVISFDRTPAFGLPTNTVYCIFYK